MRCALATCEAAMLVMQRHLRPGITEQALWAHLHAENISRGGEWIETRLLSSGPRTNPWFQECSSREVEAGDLVAFDTDLIGPYGYCADISRTWRCGGGRARNAQIDLYRRAREQIAYNLELDFSVFALHGDQCDTFRRRRGGILRTRLCPATGIFSFRI